LQFIESGQLFEDYPSVVGRDVVIETAMKYQPTSEAASFLEMAKGIIKNAGFDFCWRALHFDE
jgi:hypothetical protein